MMSVTVLRWLGYVLIAFAGLGVVLLILWAVVVVPPRLIDTSQIPDQAKRLDEVNGLRTNLLGALAGLAVIAGAAVGALNLMLTQRVQWRAQVTERFSRAIDQLGQRGPEKLDVRIGAVYALEQIARDSAELHWPIVEVLAAYLREHARPLADVERSAGTEEQLPADHQAIATVTGRRRRERDPAVQQLDLHGTRLPGVRWWRANLEHANLNEAHLKGAMLNYAHLMWAHLYSANLEGAALTGANLKGAALEGANLKGAVLDLANLEWAHLNGANLEGADLRCANLEATEKLSVGLVQQVLNVVSATLPSELASQPTGPGPSGKGSDGA